MFQVFNVKAKSVKVGDVLWKPYVAGLRIMSSDKLNRTAIVNKIYRAFPDFISMSIEDFDGNKYRCRRSANGMLKILVEV